MAATKNGLRDNSTQNEFAQPAHWAMDTASGVAPERLSQIDQLAPTCLLGASATIGLREMAEGWGVPDLGPAFREPVRSALPALCISGTLDGRTPPANAEEVLATLPNARHLVIENAAHSDDLFCSSPLIKEVMLAFLLDRPLPTTRILLPPLDLVVLEPAGSLDFDQIRRAARKQAGLTAEHG